MRRKSKLLLLGAIPLLASIVVAGGVLWRFFSQPLYQPGRVRAERNLRAPLEPPAQFGGSDDWEVEPGIQLHHFSSGSGRKALVIHGGPGYPFVQPLVGLEPLTDRFEFVYYDQRGCGLSSRPIDRLTSQNDYENIQQLDGALGLGAQVADIERIRRLLGTEQLILVGHSFGGLLAALYAAEFPERVEALILVSPAEVIVMPPPSGGLFEAVRQRLPAERQGVYDAFLKRYLDFDGLFAYSEADLQSQEVEFGAYLAEALPPYRVEQGQPGGWMARALYLSMGLQHDYRTALRTVTAPVLVVHGEDDVQPESASRLYADAFPNSQFEIIAGATHFAFEEQPAAFAAVVARFLDR